MDSTSSRSLQPNPQLGTRQLSGARLEKNAAPAQSMTRQPGCTPAELSADVGIHKEIQSALMKLGISGFKMDSPGVRWKLADDIKSAEANFKAKSEWLNATAPGLTQSGLFERDGLFLNINCTPHAAQTLLRASTRRGTKPDSKSEFKNALEPVAYQKICTQRDAYAQQWHKLCAAEAAPALSTTLVKADIAIGDVQQRDFDAWAAKLFSQQDQFVAGELHGESAPCAATHFLIENMDRLAEQGHTLCSEHFHVELQPEIDTFLKDPGATLDPLTTAILGERANGSSLKLLEAAKKHGVPVLCLDSTIAASCGKDADTAGEIGMRAAAMNRIAVYALESVAGKKAVIHVGLAHAKHAVISPDATEQTATGAATLEVPGIAHVLRCPTIYFDAPKPSKMPPPAGARFGTRSGDATPASEPPKVFRATLKDFDERAAAPGTSGPSSCKYDLRIRSESGIWRGASDENAHRGTVSAPETGDVEAEDDMNEAAELASDSEESAGVEDYAKEKYSTAQSYLRPVDEKGRSDDLRQREFRDRDNRFLHPSDPTPDDHEDWFAETASRYQQYLNPPFDSAVYKDEGAWKADLGQRYETFVREPDDEYYFSSKQWKTELARREGLLEEAKAKHAANAEHGPTS
jgi:hypothetical protein